MNCSLPLKKGKPGLDAFGTDWTALNDDGRYLTIVVRTVIF